MDTYQMTFGDHLTISPYTMAMYVHIYSQNLIANTLLLKTFKLQK